MSCAARTRSSRPRRCFRDRARRRPTEVSRFIDEHRGRFGVEPICRVLGVSASAYYERASGRRSKRAIEDERLLGRIGELHAANYYTYGYRRMWKALLRTGEQVPRCRVQRLMRAHGIVGAKRRGRPWRTTRADPDAHRRPDLVQRNFTASRPDELWVADLCYLRCWEGVVFLAFVIDAHSRRIVGWQLASHMRTTLVLDALRMALGERCRLGAPLRPRLAIHQHRLHPDLGRPRRPGIGRVGRRRLRQRARGELRRQLQDRAHLRPRLAQPFAARARRRRVRRLVHTTACTKRSATSRRPRWRPSTLP
jgi:HTH-like domain/Integrase core domain